MRRLPGTAVLAVVLLLRGSGAPGADRPLLVYSAAKVAAAPAIDGRLAEPCWQRAEKSAVFITNGGAAVAIRTQGMLCWDERNLYAALICQEPLTDALKQFVGKGALTDFQESVELFVDGNCDRATYVQFMLNVKGNKWTARGYDALEPLMNDVWSAGVAVNDGSWTAELRIPLEMVGVGQPSAATVCGLNLNRTRTVGGTTVYTCWSNTGGSFHTPARFGRLIFVGYAEWLRANVQERLSREKREIVRLTTRYPGATEPFAGRCLQLRNRQQRFLSALSSEQPDTAAAFAPLYGQGEALAAEYSAVLADMRLAVIRSRFR